MTRIALVHDWLTGMRGGEKCLEVMAELYPDADLFTLLHVPGSVSPIIENRRIVTSFVQKIPRAPKIYRWALPLFPQAIESMDFSGYDIVLSTSHCVAKSAIVDEGALSLCYCHSPMRYVWDRFDDYFGDKPFPVRQLIAAQAKRLRAWDRRTASRVHQWWANSTIVRQRILDWYGVDPSIVDVIAPPVDVARFEPQRNLPVPDGLESGRYDFVLSALVPYKKIDIAVRAAVAAGRLLVVAGGGPELARLRELAASLRGPGEVRMLGMVDDEVVPGLYAHCRSFVFPGLEDFGITPLEATAAGRPVVAYRAGGALDTIVEGLNGIFVDEQSVEAFAEALNDPRLDAEWDAAAMLAHARSFGRERYREEIRRGVETAWERHQRGD